jgi:hypothetical protein
VETKRRARVRQTGASLGTVCVRYIDSWRDSVVGKDTTIDKDFRRSSLGSDVISRYLGRNAAVTTPPQARPCNIAAGGSAA